MKNKAFKKHSIWDEAKLLGLKRKSKTYEQRGKNNRYNKYYTWIFGGRERLRITSSGNVGIGVTSPSYKLSIK